VTPPEGALVELSIATSQSARDVLDGYRAGIAVHGAPAVMLSAAAALAGAPDPGLTARSGGLVFSLSEPGVRRLAGVMMGGRPDDEVAEGELTELERSTVTEGLERLLAAAGNAATALGAHLAGPGVAEIGPAEARPEDGGAFAVSVDFEICGETARFIQLVPEDVAERIAATLDGAARRTLRSSLEATTVRFSAEVGRTRLPVDRLIGVPAGTVIELDRDADEPIDLYVNGLPFAKGRLVMTDDEEWAVRIERILDA
jgi:flagellar motor switch protein FliN